MAGRRARTGRGWDAAPARARRRSGGATTDHSGSTSTGNSAFDASGDENTRQGADGDEQARHGAPGADISGESGEFGRRDTAGRRGRSGRDAPPKPPADPHERAREICLQQLSFRPRTRAELATALRKRDIDDTVAAEVLDRYDEVGLIDDAAFAKAWVNSRHFSRGLARRALANELRQRGVDAELVDEALDEVDGETEASTARTLVDRKLRSMGSAPPEAVFRRLVAMLARKGYPAGVAIGAVKDALAAQAESAAFAGDLDVDALADMELAEGPENG